MKVIVYGIGKRYFDLFDYRENMDMGIIVNDVNIVGFSDGNPELFGKVIRYNGRIFKIKAIQEFSADEFEKIMITTSDYFEEIRDVLIRNEYRPEQIFLADDIFEPYYELMSCGNYTLIEEQWMKLFRQIEDKAYFFEAGRYQNVLVYGDGSAAKNLDHILKQAGIKVRCLLDIYAVEKQEGTLVHNVEDELSKTDIVIVADSNRYMEIEKEICERSPVEVISMQELIYKTLKNCKKGIKECAI